MKAYFVFTFILIVLFYLGKIIKEKGFDNLFIKRTINNNFVFPGEEIKITLEVENNKWLPISFLNVEEEYSKDIVRGSIAEANKNNFTLNSRLSWHERLKKTYSVIINKRGVYRVNKINVSIGDMLGLAYETKEIEDMLEFVVYPRLLDINKVMRNFSSTYGDNAVKRWIYKDDMYIKGIREYTYEDRMKDIHWKSTLRMNKLMVKECDYTSNKEIVIIIDAPYGDNLWGNISNEDMESCIEFGVALSHCCIKNGIAAGFWTNAMLMNYFGSSINEINPSMNSFHTILELAARMDYYGKLSMKEYLFQKLKYLSKNTIYVMVTSKLNEECNELLNSIGAKGYNFKLVDIANKSDLSNLRGIELVYFKGEGLDE